MTTPQTLILVGIGIFVALATVRNRHWTDYKKRPADKELFLTYTPHAFPVGSIHDGQLITRVERTSPTALAAGGTAPCWRVFGREA